jgi:predicted dehydrogenase
MAESKGLMLCVYQNRRWDADYLTVKEIIETGKIGRLVEFESTFARYRNFIMPGTWKERGSSMTYNLGSHLVDQAICLFGVPEAVFADTTIMRDSGIIDDYFIIHFLRPAKAPDVRVTVKASYLMCEPEPRFMIHGTEGSYIKFGVDKQEALLKQGVSPIAADWGIETEDEWGWLHTEKGGKKRYPSQRGHYIEFYETIYHALRLGEPSPTSARDVLPCIRVLEASEESSRTHKVIVI